MTACVEALLQAAGYARSFGPQAVEVRADFHGAIQAVHGATRDAMAFAVADRIVALASELSQAGGS
eukprot:10198793-Alexandrium_andersonii.AAC.1